MLRALINRKLKPYFTASRRHLPSFHKNVSNVGIDATRVEMFQLVML